ncbi:MAG: glycerophosphodiester phosphodiesterase, partial [SAR324 cluster bacterium]
MTVAGGLATGSVYTVGGWLRGRGRVPPPRWELPLPPPIIGAHRGGGGVFPESTLTAFVSCYEQFGCRFMELDVHVTRDGIPVVIHDATLDRTTDGTGPVAAHSLAELQRLDAGYRFRGLDGVSWA